VTELNRDDPRLLHEQLAGILRGQIESGELIGRIATGHELARRYQVSRETVAKALAALKAEGLVTSVRGRGTFVTYKPPA
jgi:DNA-binding GntR family transcriptional regulator